MKIRKYISFLCLSLSVAALVSCKDDEEVFLQRSHDAMSFGYLDSTQELLVLSNGQWRVGSEDSWITVSPEEGQGDGRTEQTVYISVAQNDDKERTGTVTLSNGLKNLTIAVSQEDGFFEMGTPAVASSFNLYEEIVDQQVLISYRKSKPGYRATVVPTLEGDGAEGISVETLTDYEMEVGDGQIPLAITGTPTKKGSIQIKLHITIASAGDAYDLTAATRAKLAGEVVIDLYKLLPRLAVFDWGAYEKTSNNQAGSTPRSFVFELSETKDGDPIRRYDAPTAKWFPATSMFFTHNRFAFGNLTPGKTYWFKIVARELGPNKEDSDPTYMEFTTPEEVLEPNVILYKDFDDFWFKGCPIYQAFGPDITNAQIGADIDPDDPGCAAATSGVVNPCNSTDSFFNYVSSATDNRGPAKAATLWSKWWEGDKYGTGYADADYPGWQGYWVRCLTGSVLLATATATGYLKTPKLAAIGEGEADITVTCHTAPYFEPYHSWGQDHPQHYIKVEGPGTITSGGPTLAEPEGVATANSEKQVTVQCTTHVDANKVPVTDYTNPTEHVVKVSGATKETRIVIETHPYGTKHYRLWIDDIKVTKD